MKHVMLPFALLLLLAAPISAQAYSAANSDAFFLEWGTSNVEMQGSNELIAGDHLSGGYRIGLFGWVFAEIDYGSISYQGQFYGTPGVASTLRTMNFRTTGAGYGLGMVIPIRNMILGGRVVTYPDNRWVQTVTDTNGVILSNTSGSLSYDANYFFGQFDKGAWEVGVRRDFIHTPTTLLSNSFGVYLMWNIHY